MSAIHHAPGMRQDRPVRNAILAVGYLACLAVVAVLAKTYRPIRGC